MNQTVADIEQALLQSGHFKRPLALTPVAGGEVNSSFRLSAGDERYFLKLFDQDELLPAPRKQQFDIQNQVAEQGLAMPIRYYNEALGFQVEHWYPGAALTEEHFSRSQKIQLFASILAKIHSLAVEAPLLPLPDIWQCYLDKSGLSQDKDYAQRYEKACEQWRQNCDQFTVLCHNDLSLMHICTDSGLKVFDWEYAATGNRFYDLMSCADVNQFQFRRYPNINSPIIVRWLDIDLQEANAQCALQKPGLWH